MRHVPHPISDVLASVWPAIDRSSLGWSLHTLAILLFGLVVGCLNLYVAALCAGKCLDGDADCDCGCGICTALLVLIGLPIALFLVITPFFGPWFIPDAVKSVRDLRLLSCLKLTIDLLSNSMHGAGSVTAIPCMRS